METIKKSLSQLKNELSRKLAEKASIEERAQALVPEITAIENSIEALTKICEEAGIDLITIESVANTGATTTHRASKKSGAAERPTLSQMVRDIIAANPEGITSAEVHAQIIATYPDMEEPKLKPAISSRISDMIREGSAESTKGEKNRNLFKPVVAA